jgi:hypothetical protein
VSISANVRSNVTNVWVEHSVREGNLKGMRIHVAFSVYNQKDMTTRLVAYFSNQNGDKIRTSSGSQLAVRKLIKPTYSNSSYRDVALFMPYRDIPGGSGTHELRFRIRLIDDISGTFFGRSEYLDFELTRS